MAEVDEKREKKPTLRTISELSGLAVPTVSRALNDAPDIGSETKKRIRQIADEIGYVPNRAGVRLRTGRTNVISLVMSTEFDLTNHTGRFISALAEQLQGTRFHMNFTPYITSDDPMKPVRYIVETGSADALILSQTTPEDPRIAYLMKRGFPFVTHGRTTWSDRHAYYDVDNRVVGELAANCLADHGRQHIFAIAPPAEQSYGAAMREGLIQIAKARSVKLTISEELTSDTPRRHCIQAVKEIMENDSSIDGIITGSSSGAMSAVAGLEAAGRVLGQDVDMFSKETTGPLLEFFRPQIFSINEDVTAAGAYCGQAALQAIRFPDKPPLQHLKIPTRQDIREPRK